jgi:predicted ATPase/DNA-binding SARP family transcriptional activator
MQVHKRGQMAHLSLGVLGSLQVLVDDAPVAALESDKVLALLVYLAVEADRPHRRESLAGLLWPECPEQVARHNLRQALFNLRRAIGDPAASPRYLLISRDAVQFNRASDSTLDLAQFRTILQACKQDRSRGIEVDSILAARLEEAVRLYRGEFLHGFFLEDSAEFEQWVLVQRESLHQQALDALSTLAEHYETHGDFQAARRHALRQLELDPWREEAHCQAMRALALDGQRSAALAQYETCRRVLAEELGVEPSATTRDLVEQIRAGRLKAKEESLSPGPAAPLHNLPVSLTSFHGREQELLDLDRLIADPECRCISLVGPGGIGKTRLALEAAQRHRAGFVHGVAFVPLASVGSAQAAIPAMAGALRLSFYGPSDPKDQLLNYLFEKQMLLTLDNVEQLLGEGPPEASFAELVLEVLRRAPGVKLLVTSREALSLQGEWVFDVGGLAFPKTEQADKQDEYAAVALFVQRARRSSPGLAFSAEDMAAIAHICGLVEGTPLAIELAATWLRVLPPAEIAREIEGSLDFLRAGSRDLPERHRSMRVVFDHSWQRLSAKEQEVLAGLSVFRGGFTRQAAEQVAGASLAALSTLVDRTLMRRGAAGRYELHELVRQYSAARLAADGGALAAQELHYRYFVVLAEAAEQGLKGRDQLEWLGRLEQEHDNLRAALEWALKGDHTAPGDDELALRLAGALRRFWLMRGHFHEGLSWLAKSLRLCPERHTAARAAALLARGALLYAVGDVDAARLPVEHSAAIYRGLGDELGLARALSVSGLMLVWEGQAGLGRARLEEALAIVRTAGDRWGEARALCRLGSALADCAGDPAGRAMLEESAAMLEEWGERCVLTSVLTSLGTFDMRRGEYGTARAHLERGLVIAREIEHPLETAGALTYLGHLYQILGEYSTAQSCLEESLQVYQAHERSLWDTEVLCALAENALAQGDMATARFRLQAASHSLGTGENKWLQMLVCCFRGLLAHYEGDAAAAIKLLEQAAGRAREGQYRPELARSLVALGRVRRTLGQVRLAIELLLEGLDLFHALGHKLGIADALDELGAVSAVQGEGAQAALLLGTAHALREQIGAPLPPVDRPAHDSVVDTCRAQLGETAFAEAWARAAARPWQEVVEEVLGLREEQLRGQRRAG